MSLEQCYRVGGFVRDTLLGLEPQDIDYVVIGESPESMLGKGFVQVGHFPVFLHPETQDEYALGRSEISNGDGHKDFLYEWAGVTLEQDLMRRDLTVNAMAMTDDGVVIDPYGGRADLEKRVLRHVSDSFAEDPLRVLRVARFAARYGFVVADETRALMTDMTTKGMLDTLTEERIWQETEKALLGNAPSRYFEVLDECGALEVVFPEIHAFFGVPQRPDHHAEGCVGTHVMSVIDQAADLSKDRSKSSRLRIMVGALLHDLGKIATPQELLWNPDGSILGKHHGHEDPARFGPLLDSFCARVKMPTDLKHFAYVCAVTHQDSHRVKEMGGKGLANMYERLGLERQSRHDPEFLEDVLLMCRADNQGRLKTLEDGSLERPTMYSQAEYVRDAMAAVASVRPGPIIQAAMARGYDLTSAKDLVMRDRRKAGEAFKKAYKLSKEDSSAMTP